MELISPYDPLACIHAEYRKWLFPEGDQGVQFPFNPMGVQVTCTLSSNSKGTFGQYLQFYFIFYYFLLLHGMAQTSSMNICSFACNCACY